MPTRRTPSVQPFGPALMMPTSSGPPGVAEVIGPPLSPLQKLLSESSRQI